MNAYARRNICCDDLPELRLEGGLAVKRLRHKRRVLAGCLGQCGYAAPEPPPTDAHDGVSRRPLGEWPDAA